MAFWGVEVKPGNPFTHSFDSVRGRLRISQATLGIGSATKRSLVQCNVGNKSPVLLCSLLPDKTESCSLDLEFEEADEVMFSVIGPRSVHLTGYYLRHGGHSNLNDDTDSYGEDIGHTESEESNRLSDEDDYDDSFIDDSDPEAYPPSPLSNGEVASEDTSDDIKPKNRKGRKRLKKKYQLSESDIEDKPQKQKIVNRRNVSVISESEAEDNFPISTLFKTENTAPNTKLEEEEKKENETGEIGKEKEAYGNMVGERESYRKAKVVAVVSEPERQSSLLVNSLKPPTEVAGPEIDMKPKKKRKERSKEKKTLEDCSVNNKTVLEEDKTKQDDASNSTSQNPPLKNQQDQAANGKRGDDLPHTRSLPSNEISPENATTPKKKRRKKSDEEKTLEGDNVSNEEKTLEEDKGQQEVAKADNICRDQSVYSKPANDKTFNDCTDRFAGEKKSEEKKTKKKKRSKTQENDENVNANVPLLSKHSQVKTLSNGLTIEELKMGEPHGKVASQGKKVSVHFIGKLKENGHVFDSNVDEAPYKFRLGMGKMIEGWDVGIDGMRVGEKRRLTIPPSLGYGSEGDNENVPPNSWLVYDVELVGAR